MATVTPTGWSQYALPLRMSGKSIAGGSAIVVVSPLISRMEDQCYCVAKLIASPRSTMWLRRHHLHPPLYQHVLRLRIIKHMRKQWKPGPFLLPLSGLGTRLPTILLVPEPDPFAQGARGSGHMHVYI